MKDVSGTKNYKIKIEKLPNNLETEAPKIVILVILHNNLIMA